MPRRPPVHIALAAAAGAAAAPVGFAPDALTAGLLKCPQPAASALTWLWGGGRRAEVVVPEDRLNDGYCDCPDGGDEAATAACSGRPLQAPFRCENAGYDAQEVDNWAVGDGVCDCCDGSDEQQGVAHGCSPAAVDRGECRAPRNSPSAGPVIDSPCRNTCEERKRKLEEERAARRAWVLRALAKRQEWIDNAKAQLSDKEAAEKLLPAQIEVAEAEVKDYEGQVSKMEEEEKEKTAAMRQAHEQGFLDTVAVKDEELPVVLTRLALSRKEKTAELVAGKLPHGSDIDDVDLLTAAMEDPPNVEAFQELLGLPGAMDTAAMRAVFDTVLREGELFPELSKAAERGNAWSGYLEFGEYPNFTHSEKSGVEEKLKEARDRRSEKQTQLDNLRETTGHDFGPDNAFYGIFKQCIKATIGEHEYEICPYDKVKQGWREVGKWKGWAPGGKYDVMEFDSGASDNCPNYQARTARVLVRCGIENKVRYVVETEVCKYDVSLDTPAACTEADAA